MNMKKLISLIIALAMILGLAACGAETQEAVVLTAEDLAENAMAATEDDNTEFLSLSDPIYSETENMLPCVETFIEYNQMLNNTIDYLAISSEDYWNIVALVVAAYPQIAEISETDIVGAYHIDYDYADDFAKTFIYEYLRTNEAPALSDSYAASMDPGTSIVDLVPIDVNNYSFELEGIEAAEENQNYKYILHLELTDNQDESIVLHYHVKLCDWSLYFDGDDGDKANHLLPYMVYGFERIEQPLVEDTSTEAALKAK